MKEKNLQHMSDRELLMELVREKRKLETLRHIKEAVIAVILVILIILGSIYIPKILAPFRQFQAMSAELEASLARFNRSMDSFDSLSEQAGGLLQQIKDLDMSRLKQTIDQLGNLDLPRLQEAADQLNSIVSRFGALFGLG